MSDDHCTNCENSPTGRDDEGQPWCDDCGVWNLDIGQAVSLLKAGQSVCRAGWNGKGMYLYMTYLAYSEVGFPIPPHVMLHNAQDEHVPWSASQSDLLANDWMRVDAHT